MKKVEVLAYQSIWTKNYTDESDKIKTALGNHLVLLHHVGSTSVPGLAAKPIIDIIAEVNQWDFPHDPLLSLGYVYRGGFNLPFRKSFTLRAPKLKVNLHIFEQEDPEIELNLLFRDYLKSHPKAKKDYETLKYQLIQKEISHQKRGTLYTGYTLGKHDLIQEIIQKTGFNRQRIVICTHDKEWAAAEKYRQQYFSDNTPQSKRHRENASSQAQETLSNESNHLHFILYQGAQIIGYAHTVKEQQQEKNSQNICMMVTEKGADLANHNTHFKALIQKALQRLGA